MKHKFMLDTDHVSYALRGEGGVGDAILAHRPSELCLSSITVAELRFGAEKRGSRRLHGLIDAFTGNLDILPFDVEAAVQYGRLAAKLAARGTPIGQLDALIAAHALVAGVSLVTNNQRHFSRIRGLKLENWAQ